MYPRVQTPGEPTLLAHPQQYRNGSVYCKRYINGLPRQKCFSSSEAQARPVFQRQDFSHYYNNVAEFNSTSGTDRSSSFLGQVYTGEEDVKEEYSTAVGRRKAPEIHDYDYGSFYDQAPVETSVNFYSHRNVASKQDSPAGNRREFLDRDNHHPYNALHGEEKLANQWLSIVTEKASPLQSSVVIPDSLTIQDEDWCERTRRNSASSMGSDEFLPFLDSGDADDNNDKYSQNRVLPPCRICGARASGFHYGVNSCEACKGFFRRALKRPITFHCTKDNTCDIKGNRRSTCRFCRYKRCLRLGMSREAIKTGRYSHRKRTSDIIEVKQLENTPGFPVDEPDFDNVLDTLMAAHDAQESLMASKETEAAIYKRQCEHIRLHMLAKIDREDTDSTSTEIDESGVPTSLSKDTIIANSSIIINNNNNNSNNNNKSEDGRLTDINNCSNANSGYPNNGAASPSLSSTSNDSGFNEDGLPSPCDESEKRKMTFCSHGPLDLSLKRKRDNEEEEEVLGKSVARQRVVADIIPKDPERSLPSLDCQSDLAEISLRDSRRSTISEGSAICCDLADELVSSPRVDSTSDVRLVKDFVEDSDSSFSTGCAQKHRKLERTDDVSEKAIGQKLPDCFLRSFDEQDDSRSAQAEQQWNKGDNCRGNRCSRKASDASECFFGLRAVQDTVIDQGNGNDEGDRSGLRGSTVKCDHDGVTFMEKKLTEDRSLEAAKKWVAGYINFAKTIPGFIDLPAQTKGVLLRQAWDEVWMLQAYSGYNRDLGVVTMPSERCLFQDEMDKVWGQENTQAAFDVAHVIKRCRLTQEMRVLLKAVCIVSPDRCPPEGRDKAEQIHWCLVTCLFKLIENMNSEDFMTFPKLVTVLTSLRNLSETAQRTRQDGCLDQSFGSALFPDCLRS